MDLPLPVLDRIIDRALEEDLAGGDVTSEACIDATRSARGLAVARKPLVACGSRVFARVFQRVESRIDVEEKVRDGSNVEPGTTLWEVRGPARGVLMGERVALNLVQRMSGIATVTQKYVGAVAPGAKTRITDTRKTTPGLRVLERYAVRTGGGKNHRDNLGSAVLIKDNHIVACGGVRTAIERARSRAPHTSRIECEVDSLAGLDEALLAGADVILLDNMDTEMVAEAVRRTKGRALLEASGGITLPRVHELSLAGVDAISVGALTHSVEAADIGLDFT